MNGRPKADVEPRLSYVIGRLDRVLRSRLAAAVGLIRCGRALEREGAERAGILTSANERDGGA
jgi:hypothetical protein